MRIRLGMVVIVATIVSGVASIRAERGTVITKDGRTLRGEVTREGDQVRINRGGIVIVLGKDEIKEIQTEASVAAEYARRLAKLSRDDVAGHLKLAEWCRDRELLKQARQRCEHVLELAPDHTNAKLLLRALGKRLSVKSKAPRPSETGKTPKKWRQGDLLTKEQMSRIRMAEFVPGERVSVRFKNDVLERFLKLVGGREGYDRRGYRQDFMAMTGAEKLAEIVKATGMYFAEDIEVRSDPEAIRIFKSDVMPLIKANCASLRCHGSSGAPKIRLYTQNTPAALYTNFYMLDSFQKLVPGRDKVGMFDRGYPEDGLFLHYLLPAALADRSLAHPGDIEPAVRGKDDRRYERALDWIKEVLRQPRQDPGIELKPEKKDQKKPAATPDRSAPSGDKKVPSGRK